MPTQSTADYLKSLEAINGLESSQQLPTLEERLKELRVVCRDAAAIEQRRGPRQQRSTAVELWPESTRLFLKRHAERHRG